MSVQRNKLNIVFMIVMALMFASCGSDNENTGDMTFSLATPVGTLAPRERYDSCYAEGTMNSFNLNCNVAIDSVSYVDGGTSTFDNALVMNDISVTISKPYLVEAAFPTIKAGSKLLINHEDGTVSTIPLSN
ncbi:hypothetical protein OAB57_03910 [Bacteriovoracaceae bacterium]|nr:hypothetical protein [Bacteriovoracaceae bacterium]